MYYLRPQAGPVPAEGPALCTVNEKHEWQYGLIKHKEAVVTTKSSIDQAKPKSYDQRTMAVQQNGRQFKKDLAKAEIGRENRKMVERLEGIARGRAGHGKDPRAPPPAHAAGALPIAALRPHAASGTLVQASRRDNDGKRLMKQKFVDLDNAGMVRRILAAKPTKSLDSGQLADAFDKHLRARSCLHKLPHDGPVPLSRSKSAPRTLPPLQRPTGPVTLTGLEFLFVPGDLARSKSGPASLALEDTQKTQLSQDTQRLPATAEDDPEPELAASAPEPELAASAPEQPAPAAEQDEAGVAEEKAEVAEEKAERAEVEQPPLPTSDVVDSPPPAATPIVEGPNEPSWDKTQTETERRVWASDQVAEADKQPEEPKDSKEDEPKEELADTLAPLNSELPAVSAAEDAQDAPDAPETAKSSEKPDPKGMTGMSESSVGYDDSWDQASMQSPSNSQLPSVPPTPSN